MFCKIRYEFRYHDGHRETMDVIREFKYPAEAHVFADADAAAAQRTRSDEFAQVRVLSVAPVKTGKTWVVTMDGTARHKEFGIHDLHNVIFVDAEDPHDAEQVAYRTWEKHARESGFERISIWRTLVELPQKPNTTKET